jgi:hypothetical protein
MSILERRILERHALAWYAEVTNMYYPQGSAANRGTWVKASDKATREPGQALANEVSSYLLTLRTDIKVAPGFQGYDPFVRCVGVSKGTYAALVSQLSSTDGGRPAAQSILSWMTEDTPELRDLPKELALFIVIVFFAELCRGYRGELNNFENWMEEIANSSTPDKAAALWMDYRFRWVPSLTFAEDSRMDYIPPS